MARSVAQGLRLIRDALSLVRGDAETVALAPRPTDEVADLIEGALLARSRAAEAALAADRATEEAARRPASHDISRRDAAALLGLSHQRIQQLVDRS